MKTIDKDILKLAAPAIINNVTVPLLGICDTAVSGHLGDATYLGAIAVGAMMLNVFFWLSGFLRMGTTGLTARAYGSRDWGISREIMKKSLLIAGAISFVVLLLQSPIASFLLKVISPDAAVTGLARRYFKICVWGVPAQLTIMVVSGWFIGMQNTLVPMFISIGVNVINILLSIWFAFGGGLGFIGIAYGTLTANWIGCIVAIVWSRIELRKFKTNQEERTQVKWIELFSVNGNLFVRSACVMGVSLTVTAMGARLGDLTLAANAVMMQFFLFFSYFMDGFAFSGEALTGKYSGAENGKMVLTTAGHLTLWGLAMALTFFLIYFFFSGTISSLLTDNPEVLKEIERYSGWIAALPPLTVLAFVFDGIFIGLTRTGAMTIVTLVGASVFFALVFSAGKGLGNGLLWTAFELYLLLRGGLLAIDFVIIERKKLNL